MRLKPEKKQFSDKSPKNKKTAICDFCHRSFTQKSLESHILVCRVGTGISQKRLKKKVSKDSKDSAVQEKVEALDTFNLKEDSTVPVTRKPPLQTGASKKMSHKLPEFQAEQDYHDTSARSSPSVSIMSEKSDKNHEEWVVVDPKADKEFLENVRKRIMSCVSLKKISEPEIASEEKLVNGNHECYESDVENEICQQSEAKNEKQMFSDFPEREDISETEDGSDVEDALFLISEVLYGK